MIQVRLYRGADEPSQVDTAGWPDVINYLSYFAAYVRNVRVGVHDGAVYVDIIEA